MPAMNTIRLPTDGESGFHMLLGMVFSQNPRNPYLGLSLPGELYFGGVCRHVGRSAGRSAGRPAGRPGGARVVSGAEKKII